MSFRKKILYCYPQHTTFIQRDIDLLSENYAVKTFNLQVNRKYQLPFKMLQQLFFLFVERKNCSAFVCHFAGYSSFFPAILGKLLGIPCYIIIAGTDAACFTDFQYGNYTKKIYGWFTKISIQMATLTLPVHESLVWQKYNYYEGGKPAQGYTAFATNTQNIPFTPIYYGYDSEIFKPLNTIERKKNSFITIGNLNSHKVFIRKGFDLIIELAKAEPELHFTLVGWDGKTKIDVPDNVTVIKFTNTEGLVKLLSEHEFYFQLSIMEGFPNALAEAMLCGCIPIGSDVSGIPFIIDNTGYILKYKDLKELMQIIDKAIANDNNNTLSHLARKRIQENFSYEYRKNKLIEIIESAET